MDMPTFPRVVDPELSEVEGFSLIFRHSFLLKKMNSTQLGLREIRLSKPSFQITYVT